MRRPLNRTENELGSPTKKAAGENQAAANDLAGLEAGLKAAILCLIEIEGSMLKKDRSPSVELNSFKERLLQEGVQNWRLVRLPHDWLGA